jgi:uncharacterized Zn finger protein (UPF0148 family)
MKKNVVKSDLDEKELCFECPECGAEIWFFPSDPEICCPVCGYTWENLLEEEF